VKAFVAAKAQTTAMMLNNAKIFFIIHSFILF
jgi:hypothetical protein